MSELRLTRRVARGDLESVALLRVRYELELAELVGLVLASSRIPAVVDRTFELAASHLRVGVRPDDLRTWLLVLARELALTEAREQPGPLALPADDCPLLAYERTILHLHRRCGIGLDELAAALSLDRMRLWMELVRLDRRFFDMIALRLLVVEGDSRCGTFSLRAGEGDPALLLERAREHARTCPECRERIEARASATDMLGRATTPAAAFVAQPRRATPARKRRHATVPVAILAVGAAAVAATAVAVTVAVVRSGSPAGTEAGPTTATTTQAAVDDVSPPQAPPSVKVAPSGSVLVGANLVVSWAAASDDRGVVSYEVYVDGVRVGESSGTRYSVTGLKCGRSVSVGVAAFDAAGNRSPVTSVIGSTAACEDGQTS